MAELMFSLVGDLHLSGALPEWKRNHFWEQLVPLKDDDPQNEGDKEFCLTPVEQEEVYDEGESQEVDPSLW